MHVATPASPHRDHELGLWGGKGHSLLAISQWGVTVPPFFIIPSSLFTVLGPLPTDRSAGEMRHIIWERAAAPAIREMLRSLITDGLKAIGDAEWVAVRSSASDEDAGGASLAGQMDTFLNVPCRTDDILQRVIFCWQSLYSDRAVSYRQQKQLDATQQAMAVVVQVMVPSERSLVAFSANPLNRDPDQMLISAVWGLGEALVSGAVDADQFVITAGSGKPIETTPGGQAQMAVRPANGGVAMIPVPAEKQGVPVLGEAELTKVHAMLATLARSAGRPVDVEAAMVGDTLYCLQCRPITTPIGGRRLLWDNSNIVESYAGVTTPLTFSFASFCYDVVYTLFGRMLGVNADVHRRHAREMKTYLGLMNGRVYYNLLTWYRSMAYLPGFAFTRTAMENMMGVKESLNYELPKAGTTWEKWTRDLPEMVGMIGRILYYFATIDAMVDDFQGRFNRVYLKYRDASFTGWSADRCLDLWTEFQNELLHHWQAPIMSDTGAMIGYALLRKSCEKWLPDLPGIQNDLLAGEGGIESTQPTKRLLALAQKLQAIPDARETLTDLDTFRRAMANDPRFAGIQTDWDDWLVRYGDRCMNELKLEEPSLREKPGFLLQMLRNYLNMPSIDLHAMEAQEQAVRAKAEADADERLGPWRRFWFHRIVRWARKHVKNRENLRFARTRMFGLMRRVFLTIGEDFQREGVLKARDDVFYLAIDELVAYVDGRSVTRDLGALAELRKNEFHAFRSDEPDERFMTTGLPHWNQQVRAPKAAMAADGDLVGTPCCPGVIEGRTKMVRDPGDDMTLNGEILVAPRTDPGWVALYPAVSGLLIEKGSVLSHSAIVARELGLPTIVGIKGLCDRLAGGQTVRMDGAAGRVEILE
jgi:pyruvate,water dikinase